MNTYYDVISQLEKSMNNNGFYPSGIILNDNFHRFARDGKGSKKSCWYIGRCFQLTNGKWVAFCVYSDWKISEKFYFKSDMDFSESEWSEVKKKKVEFEKTQEELERKRHERAKKMARQIWLQAKPVSSHNYLSQKKIVNPIGTKIYKNALVIPMRTLEGDMIGLQFINSAESKRFLKGQKNKGSFFLIGHDTDLANIKSVNVVEGVATGFSVFAAEKKTVICAFSKGNIENVCNELKLKYPLLKIKICADNDRFTDGNPGISAAEKAANKFNAWVAIPRFSENDNESTDFNDLHVTVGLDEVRKQLENAVPPKSEAPPAAQLAEDFLLMKGLVLANRPSLLFWQGEFYQYQNGYYKQFSQLDLFSKVISFLQVGSGARAKATTRLVNDVISNLKGYTHIDSGISLPSWIDKSDRKAKDYISIKNGLLNVARWRSGSSDFIEDHTPNFFTTAQIPCHYDSEARCPIWLGFLEQVQPDPTARKMLQQWFGYNLVNDVSFQKFLIMYGEGSNGKSVVCTVLRTLLGTDNISATTLESIDPKRTFPLAATAGKLANIVGELNATDKTAEGELKKFVSGEAMTVERKFGHPFTFIPTARLTFSTNILPRFSDTTDGIWRRLLLLPFENQILDPQKQNRNLIEMSWWESSGEMSGIFNWALEGLKELYDAGYFVEPKSAMTAKEKYRSDSNPTRTFLLDNYEEKNGSTISSRKIYQHYSISMRENGHYPLANNRLPDEVKRAFPSVTITKNPQTLPVEEAMEPNQSRCRLYLGLAIKKE